MRKGCEQGAERMTMESETCGRLVWLPGVPGGVAGGGSAPYQPGAGVFCADFPENSEPADIIIPAFF